MTKISNHHPKPVLTSANTTEKHEPSKAPIAKPFSENGFTLSERSRRMEAGFDAIDGVADRIVGAEDKIVDLEDNIVDVASMMLGRNRPRPTSAELRNQETKAVRPKQNEIMKRDKEALHTLGELREKGIVSKSEYKTLQGYIFENSPSLDPKETRTGDGAMTPFRASAGLINGGFDGIDKMADRIVDTEDKILDTEDKIVDVVSMATGEKPPSPSSAELRIKSQEQLKIPTEFNVSSNIKALSTLYDLQKNGVINEKEFETVKEQLIATSSPSFIPSLEVREGDELASMLTAPFDLFDRMMYGGLKGIDRMGDKIVDTEDKIVDTEDKIVDVISMMIGKERTTDPSAVSRMKEYQKKREELGFTPQSSIETKLKALTKLDELRKSGKISKPEFATGKSKILKSTLNEFVPFSLHKNDSTGMDRIVRAPFDTAENFIEGSVEGTSLMADKVVETADKVADTAGKAAETAGAMMDMPISMMSSFFGSSRRKKD